MTIAALLWFRHRRRQKYAPTSVSEPQGGDGYGDGDISVHEVSGQPRHELSGSIGHPGTYEAAGQPRHELHGPLDRPELHGSRNLPPQELDGG